MPEEARGRSPPWPDDLQMNPTDQPDRPVPAVADCFKLLTAFTPERPMTVEYVQAEDFEALVAQETVVVADFTASWCGPCKLVAPLMDQLGEAFTGKAKVVKVDLDANKSLAKTYSIRSIPAVLFFKDGALAETLVGVKPYSVFEETLNKYL